MLTFVDRKEALTRYIKENIIKLTSENATKYVEKKIRKEFSERHNLKSDSRFSGKDVAEGRAVLHSQVNSAASCGDD